MTACYYDGETYEFVCRLCLTREPVKLPMALETLAEEALQFAREHQRCKPAVGPGFASVDRVAIE